MVRRSEIDATGRLKPPRRGVLGLHSSVGLGLTEPESEDYGGYGCIRECASDED